MRKLNSEQMRQLSGWMGFVGIITIIGGVLSLITVVGIIPGIIAIILGVKLRTARQYADSMLVEAGDYEFPGSFGLFVANLNTYFKIQGILIIISLVLAVLSVFVGLFAGFAFYSFGY